MYRLIKTPDELEKPIKHSCKFCHNPHAEHKVEYPMNKLSIGAAGGKFVLYTYAAFCVDCNGLSVVALKGNFPELEDDFDGVSYG